MRILFCDNTLWGLINFRGSVITHFLEAGHEVVLVAPEKEDRQMRTTVPQGVRYLPIDMGRTSTNPLNDLRLFARLLQLYRNERPDHIFHYTIKPNIYGSIAAKLCGIPCTAMMAGTGYAFTSQTASARLARMLYKVGLSFTSQLLLLNEENRQTVTNAHLCDPKKIILLRGGEGVDCEHFQMHDNESEQTTFLFIGRVLWEKGYKEFVEAAEIVKQAYPDARFQILGSLDPSYPNSVPEERVQADVRKGLIEYRGFVSDMAQVYRQPGLVITLPSFYGEGLNRSLLEACASGKPIITTDIAGCRELVENGKNGYTVPPKDSPRLAEAMLQYLRSSREQQLVLSLHSRKMAEERFNIKDVIALYDHIINDTLQPHHLT